MIIFGAPARNWFEKTYGVKLVINQVQTISAFGGTPVIYANHPSLIFHYKPNQPSWNSTGMKEGLKYMWEDLVSSCWQSSMMRNRNQDPTTAMVGCNV